MFLGTELYHWCLMGAYQELSTWMEHSESQFLWRFIFVNGPPVVLLFARRKSACLVGLTFGLDVSSREQSFITLLNRWCNIGGSQIPHLSAGKSRQWALPVNRPHSGPVHLNKIPRFRVQALFWGLVIFRVIISSPGTLRVYWFYVGLTYGCGSIDAAWGEFTLTIYSVKTTLNEKNMMDMVICILYCILQIRVLKL